MNPNDTVAAWIDVGGTFTDCYVQLPAGILRRCKILSSGLVPISRHAVKHMRSLTDDATDLAPAVGSELASDPAGFWCGAKLRVLNADGKLLSTHCVAHFSDGQIECDSPLPVAEAGTRLELDAGLESPVLAVRRLLGIGLTQALPALRVRLGTTRGTNALLTRRGAPTVLATTAPFEDLLSIGDQTRPNLFELTIRKPEPLVQQVVGIRERLYADGQVALPLDVAHATDRLTQARAAGCTSLAICLMHSYRNPQHELELESLAAELGFEHISRSSAVAPLIEMVARTQTAVVDAYLSPMIRTYLSKLVEQFGTTSVQLDVMTSAGGLTCWDRYAGKDSILSGPAGGVVALQGLSRSLDMPQLIGLDMGGTSTDVCRIGADHQLQYESTKAGVRILTPTLPIETVAAGGGSICWFDGVSLRVGPQSAGAAPGPACYGRGGPLTITDLNVFLGRLPEQQFPFPLDLAAIDRRLGELLEQVRATLPIRTPEQLAEGLRRLANEQMAAAVRTVSTAQGADPRKSALVGFGGAAGQHICQIAELLGISQVIDYADAGLMSALGMGLASERRDAAIPVYQSLRNCTWDILRQSAARQTEQLFAGLQAQGHDPRKLHSEWWAELRYVGTDATLTVPWSDTSQQVADCFHAEHQRRFGYARHERDIELVSIRIECHSVATYELHREHRCSLLTQATPSPAVAADGTTLWQRQALVPGQTCHGPAVILNAGSTLAIDAGWSATVLSGGTLLLEHDATRQPPNAHQAQARSLEDSHSFDPVTRDCLAQRLSAIATQMGVVLQQTAVSVNVKQRRDFSCAIFDREGLLLANAPHVPVHLGAMGQTVRSMIAAFPQMQPGDCFVTNDPYRGGSHLPDVTVVTPVFSGNERPEMFVANRAHHADIGGLSPGSMSVTATRLGQEGVIIPPMRLVQAGQDQTDDLRLWMQRYEFPPRKITENLADLAAQQAANSRGVALLEELARAQGWTLVHRYSNHLLAAAAERVAQFLKGLPQAARHFTDHMDDGTCIAVDITFPMPGKVRLDFGRSGPVSLTNFNANPSIVSAAIMYTLRCLIADEMPMNEGILRSVELLIPEGILNPTPAKEPSDSPAVAAGNVETSQRVVDVLLGALGGAAASQGTMNNLLFGNATFGFYETICGGAGATEGCDGASAIHTHMTNTRLTDPEVLESRYPVRLIAFHIRRNSGGGGRWRGGDGIVRELEFLEEAQVSLLTSRRGPYLPYGVDGGLPGASGHNVLMRRSGRAESLPNCCQINVQAGDRIHIETPGGGGWGLVR